MSLVLPVNIQNPGTPFLIAQIGYGRIGSSGRVFLWTEDVTSSPAGTMTVFPNAETPQVGHTYLFYIAYRSADDAWKFTIQDVDDNQSWSNFSDTETTQVHGNELWAGFEVYDSNDQMGGAGANIYHSNIGYIKVGESTIGYLTTTADQHTTKPGQSGHQSYWSTYADTSGGRSRIRSNTVDH